MKSPRPRYYILDADNRPVAADMITWARFWEADQNRPVDSTDITSEVHISTVFIGIDHRFLGEGPPILFETMIFGGPLDQYQWRYSSWDDAITGHKVAVRQAREVHKNEIRHHQAARTQNSDC